PGQVGRNEWEGDHDRGFGNDPDRRDDKVKPKDQRDDTVIRSESDDRDDRDDRERGVGNEQPKHRDQGDKRGKGRVPDGPGWLDRDKGAGDNNRGVERNDSNKGGGKPEGAKLEKGSGKSDDKHADKGDKPKEMSGKSDKGGGKSD
ncbi:MAG: hypothetical protein HUU35_19475, partial [Armatimonadetes bacterium]|nr:hypothetical protein [Armatimonadota bacterium]